MEDAGFSEKQLQVLLVHAAYGRAMMAAHSLESKLVALLMCHAVENNYPIDKDSIKKMTLGVLTKEFVAKFKPSEQIEEELDNMVFFRNDLAHRISDSITWFAQFSDWPERAMEN